MGRDAEEEEEDALEALQRQFGAEVVVVGDAEPCPRYLRVRISQSSVAAAHVFEEANRRLDEDWVFEEMYSVMLRLIMNVDGRVGGATPTYVRERQRLIPPRGVLQRICFCLCQPDSRPPAQVKRVTRRSAPTEGLVVGEQHHCVFDKLHESFLDALHLCFRRRRLHGSAFDAVPGCIVYWDHVYVPFTYDVITLRVPLGCGGGGMGLAAVAASARLLALLRQEDACPVSSRFLFMLRCSPAWSTLRTLMDPLDVARPLLARKVNAHREHEKEEEEEKTWRRRHRDCVWYLEAARVFHAAVKRYKGNKWHKAYRDMEVLQREETKDALVDD